MRLIILLSLFLVSCRTPETSLERCLVDIKHYSCICHKYEINKSYIGKIGETYEKPFEYCDKMIGFTTDNWGELRYYLGRVQNYFHRGE